jgi:hypothetical protein
MEDAKTTEQPVNTESSGIEQKHIDGIYIADLLMQTGSFSERQYKSSGNYGDHSGY